MTWKIILPAVLLLALASPAGSFAQTTITADQLTTISPTLVNTLNVLRATVELISTRFTVQQTITAQIGNDLRATTVLLGETVNRAPGWTPAERASFAGQLSALNFQLGQLNNTVAAVRAEQIAVAGALVRLNQALSALSQLLAAAP